MIDEVKVMEVIVKVMVRLKLPIPIRVDGVIYHEYTPYHIQLLIEKDIPKGAKIIHQMKKVKYELDTDSKMRYTQLNSIDKNTLYIRMVGCKEYNKLSGLCNMEGVECKVCMMGRKCPLDKHELG